MTGTTAVVTPEPPGEIEPPAEAKTLGVQLAEHRHSARSYARSVVRRWPALTEEQRAEVRSILSPVTADTSGGR